MALREAVVGAVSLLALGLLHVAADDECQASHARSEVLLQTRLYLTEEAHEDGGRSDREAELVDAGLEALEDMVQDLEDSQFAGSADHQDPTLPPHLSDSGCPNRTIASHTEVTAFQHTLCAIMEADDIRCFDGGALKGHKYGCEIGPHEGCTEMSVHSICSANKEPVPKPFLSDSGCAHLAVASWEEVVAYRRTLCALMSADDIRCFNGYSLKGHKYGCEIARHGGCNEMAVHGICSSKKAPALPRISDHGCPESRLAHVNEARAHQEALCALMNPDDIRCLDGYALKGRAFGCRLESHAGCASRTIPHSICAAGEADDASSQDRRRRLHGWLKEMWTDWKDDWVHKYKCKVKIRYGFGSLDHCEQAEEMRPWRSDGGCNGRLATYAEVILFRETLCRQIGGSGAWCLQGYMLESKGGSDCEMAANHSCNNESSKAICPGPHPKAPPPPPPPHVSDQGCSHGRIAHSGEVREHQEALCAKMEPDDIRCLDGHALKGRKFGCRLEPHPKCSERSVHTICAGGEAGPNATKPGQQHSQEVVASDPGDAKAGEEHPAADREEAAEGCVATNGKQCAFPFKYLGVSYKTCTTHDAAGKAWCSTKTDSNGEHVVGEFGECPADCEVVE